jgi:hypothetical protein
MNDNSGLTTSGRAVVLERALLAYAKELGVPVPDISSEELDAGAAMAKRLTPKI